MFVSLHSEKMNYRAMASLVGMLLGITIDISIFYDKGFYHELCGPLAISSHPKFIPNLILIEAVAALYPLILRLASLIWKHNFLIEQVGHNYVIKNLIILVLKLGIILGQAHRLKYYVHTLLIELTILVISLLMDFTTNQNICEVWDIVITTSFHRIALFYEITRTFCPNFAIYWFITALLHLCISQAESHSKSNSGFPLYPTALYVRQDVYRFMILGLLYLALFGLLQSHIYGYGMALTFLISAYPFYKAIRAFEENRMRQAMGLLALVCLCVCGLILARIRAPRLFVPLGMDSNHSVCASYQFLLLEHDA